MPPFPRSDQEPETFVLLLVEGLSMMSLACAVEPLRAANRLVGREVYRWRLASLEGAPIAASNGIPIPAGPVAEAIPGADLLFVCGGLRMRAPEERRHLAALRAAARAGLALGSLSTGAHLLARAGLLDHYRCTIHWENRAAFEEEFPDVVCTGKIYEIDRDRLTCSGGTAALDLMLHLVGERLGDDLARQVANQFHHERIRDGRDEQRGGRLLPLATLPAHVRAAIALMQARIEDPVSVADLAAEIGVSARQIERLFLRYLKTRPARYYLSLRVDRARELLLYSDRPILDVAVATGFTSTSHFSQWFRHFHGVRPSELRGRPAPAREGRE